MKGGFQVYSGYKTNICSFDLDIKKRLTFVFLKGEFAGYIKAVECGQQSIYFSFKIEDHKSLFDISKWIKDFRVSEKSFSNNITKILAKPESGGDPIATTSIWLNIILLKLNSTEDVAFFTNSTNTSLRMSGHVVDSSNRASEQISIASLR